MLCGLQFGDYKTDHDEEGFIMVICDLNADGLLPWRHLVTASLKIHRLLLASAAVVIAMPEFAQAQQQDIDPNTTVADRARPAYDPLGIRAGSFLAFPELAITGGYTDNVGFDEDDEDSSIFADIAPSIEFESQWSRHRLATEFGSNIALYADDSDENYHDFFALGAGRIDVSRQTNIVPDAEFRYSHVERDDPEDDGDDDLTELFIFGGGLALNHQINRLGFTIGGDIVRNDYDNSDDNDRDANFYSALLRTSYEVSPRLDMFVEGVYSVEDRDDRVDDDGIERDTDGYEARLGAAFDITSVLFGEAFAGYARQNYDESAFDDEDGLSFGIDLDWNPTLLTTIGISGVREFVPTDEGDAASNFQTEIGLTIDHEMMRNLILNGRARYQNDDFRGDGGREDDTYRIGGGLTYLLNRNLSLNAGYDYSDRNSNEDGEDFKVNEISIGFTARL